MTAQHRAVEAAPGAFEAARGPLLGRTRELAADELWIVAKASGEPSSGQAPSSDPGTGSMMASRPGDDPAASTELVPLPLEQHRRGCRDRRLHRHGSGQPAFRESVRYEDRSRLPLSPARKGRGQRVPDGDRRPHHSRHPCARRRKPRRSIAGRGRRATARACWCSGGRTSSSRRSPTSSPAPRSRSTSRISTRWRTRTAGTPSSFPPSSARATTRRDTRTPSPRCRGAARRHSRKQRALNTWRRRSARVTTSASRYAWMPAWRSRN